MTASVHAQWILGTVPTIFQAEGSVIVEDLSGRRGLPPFASIAVVSPVVCWSIWALPDLSFTVHVADPPIRPLRFRRVCGRFPCSKPMLKQDPDLEIRRLVDQELSES